MSCVIFGAGKIARGFVGHLLYLSGIDFVFVEKVDSLVDLINERSEYLVNILGDESKNTVVKGAKALKFSQTEEISKAIAEADCIFNSVGGKNLGDIVPYLTAGIELRAKVNPKPLNIITCENWKKPADILKDGIAATISADCKEFFCARQSSPPPSCSQKTPSLLMRRTSGNSRLMQAAPRLPCPKI